ncbi:fluconazole resistance protein [Penicillium canescens]|uniref:Fluconazole resistance protein n=1 Tax=Penicillium canescens TaxID=5083 RepID=A0AAD6I394_PENCN|nr:fluconazole resistance protein [Penicillium canescens]KAJ6029865.1 fluconazole resistance protein [Penicillium canescens]KAJ6060247.1 fluconazole resistance protein [Penicillium canescens]KAJ6063601.1 fluconazole resistance protein [Penicillium canescens]KAJ6078136.1 fluconazole resistance protein [Penicillium canescens]KAJ6154903.1 fluconazole resistance protein [Penicillium canescens]
MYERKEALVTDTDTGTELDLEKASFSGPHPNPDADRFAPIPTGIRPTSHARQSSSASAHSRIISSTPSHNGYSCDDFPASSDENPPLASSTNPVPILSSNSYIVSFTNGDLDPWCPRSLPTPRRWLIVALVSGASFCVTAASSIYTSTYTQMDAEFRSSRILSTLGLSTFVLGISLGPLFLSPLSEFYGRRPIYLAAWSMYIIWIIPSAMARNIETMIVARFLDGLSGSAFLAVSGGTVSDLFSRNDLQGPMLLYSMAPFIGPAIGPTVGGFINYYTQWRWTFYVLLIWAFVMGLAIVFLVPETYRKSGSPQDLAAYFPYGIVPDTAYLPDPVVLRNKARKMRADTGDDRWRAPMEKSTKSIRRTVGLSLLRPFQVLFFEPIVLLLCIFSAILLGVLYLFFGAFPLVFGNTHGFNLWQIGLAFNGILVGMLCAAVSDPLWHAVRKRLIRNLERDTGEPCGSEPEFRLPPAIIGGFLVTIGLFVFAWTINADVHWIAPVIGSGIFAAGTVLVFTGIFTFLVDAYPLYAASALAANAFVRCMFAAAFPLFGNRMYEDLGYSWASSLLAFLTVAMLPFPYLFFRYGKKIRGHSRFARAWSE